jgi:hypothetical protein
MHGASLPVPCLTSFRCLSTTPQVRRSAVHLSICNHAANAWLLPSLLLVTRAWLSPFQPSTHMLLFAE